MARRPVKTAADKAAIRIKEIQDGVKALITGWKSRMVTRQQWHDAHDMLAELYFLNPAEWHRSEKIICEQYEAWRQYTGTTA